MTILARLKNVVTADRRFNRDVLWNVASLGVLGVAGVAINVVIARDPAYGENALGVFNQVFAFYIVLSQFAVAGVHLSALKYVSHSQDDPAKCSAISSAALLLSTAMALVVSLAAFLLRDAVGALWQSSGVSRGIALVAPGLLLFSINKVLISILNGLRHMRAFAVFQALRYILIVAVLIAMMKLHYAVDTLAAALSIAEAVLFIGLVVYTQFRAVSLVPRQGVNAWFKLHLDFGLRGCLSGVLAEMNTRVDVLLLGLFLDSEALVGLYSFAAIPAEAIGQLIMIVRRNVDPVIGAHFAKGELEEINAFARRIKRVVYLGMTGVTLAAIAAYPLAIKLFVPDKKFMSTWPIFAILALGMAMRSGYRAFGGVLLQGGRPGTQTLFVLGVVIGNIVLNALLIPIWGIYGSAIATSIVFMIEAYMIRYFARRLFGLRL